MTIQEAIALMCCVRCMLAVQGFEDPGCWADYEETGLCQNCQDDDVEFQQIVDSFDAT